MQLHLLHEAIRTSIVTVMERAEEASASEQSASATEFAELRHSSEERAASNEANPNSVYARKSLRNRAVTLAKRS